MSKPELSSGNSGYTLSLGEGDTWHGGEALVLQSIPVLQPRSSFVVSRSMDARIEACYTWTSKDIIKLNLATDESYWKVLTWSSLGLVTVSSGAGVGISAKFSVLIDDL